MHGRNPTVLPFSLRRMRRCGGGWFAYASVSGEHEDPHGLRFLRVGRGCTHLRPPPRYPNGAGGPLGGGYLLYGPVDLETGQVRPLGWRAVDEGRARLPRGEAL